MEEFYPFLGKRKEFNKIRETEVHSLKQTQCFLQTLCVQYLLQFKYYSIYFIYFILILCKSRMS